MNHERESDPEWLLAAKKFWAMLMRFEVIGAVAFVGWLVFFGVRNRLLGLI